MSLTSLRIVPPLLLLLFSSLLRAAEPKIQRDIPYAEPKNERQTLDVYAPGQWDIRTAAPQAFENRTDRLPMPHTEHLGVCPDCGGPGTLKCTHCHGWGKVNCTWCNGTGSRTVTRTVTDPNPDGGFNTRMETVQESCGSCFMGKVNCGFCHGHGHTTCSTCAGGGKVKFSSELVVTLRYTTDDRVAGKGLPDHLALATRGEALIDTSETRIGTCPPVSPEADGLIADMLARSHDESDHSRLLFQHLLVEQVPAYEVTYTYRGEKVHRLWIYGKDFKVHAPGAPWRWLLATALVGLAVVAVGAGLVALAQAFP